MLLRIALLTIALSFSGLAFGAGEIALMPGEVIQGHAKLEAECKECHVRFNKAAQTGLCEDCHKDVKADIQNHQGFHGRLADKECRTCHTEHKGRNAKIVILDTTKFDHTKTDFPLLGAHQNQEKVKCKDCHAAKKKFREAPSACNDCHHKDDKHKGSLGTDCKSCHNERDWKEAKFDHTFEKTHFALKGKHLDVKCSKCHVTPGKYKGAPLECVACHIKVDKHKGKYGKKCETCHVERDWKAIQFNHDVATKFKLLGKHQKVKCISCHTAPLFTKAKTPTACIGCHRKDDVHKGGLGTNCATCHNEQKWKSAKFNHDRDTKFSLKGKHEQVKCDACHTPQLKAKGEKLPMACIGCHRKDDNKAHKGKFGSKCESCHVEKNWKEILFDHGKATKYPLLGKHKEAKCTSCHKGELYKEKLPTICLSCHEKEDKHKGQEGKKCETCHSEQSWKKTTFNHGKMSTFPLLGRHMLVDCKKCHLAETFKDAKSSCWSCHEKDDVHKRKFGTECKDCHNTRDWKAWDFNHNKTGFKLDGPHNKTGCYKCHQRPMSEKVILSKACGSCHYREDVHNGSFGDQCQRCHIGDKWNKVKIGIGK
jgi:ribosomal protein L15